MILCVGANAAIDKTVVVPNFRLNEIQRPRKVIALPGGKGCNVARALKCLGGQPVVTGWVGGSAGQFIEDGLRRGRMIFTMFSVEPLSRNQRLNCDLPSTLTRVILYPIERGSVAVLLSLSGCENQQDHEENVAAE